MSRSVITIADLAEHVDQEVTIRGWVYNWRKKGKLRFIILRDGFGYLQSVVFRPEVDESVWETAVELTQESSVEVTGLVAADDRAPGGFSSRCPVSKLSISRRSFRSAKRTTVRTFCSTTATFGCGLKKDSTPSCGSVPNSHSRSAISSRAATTP